MTQALTALADRMLGAVAPRTTAQAACSCKSVFCYCSGTRRYTKSCCYSGTNCTQLECGYCRFTDYGC